MQEQQAMRRVPRKAILAMTAPPEEASEGFFDYTAPMLRSADIEDDLKHVDENFWLEDYLWRCPEHECLPVIEEFLTFTKDKAELSGDLDAYEDYAHHARIFLEFVEEESYAGLERRVKEVYADANEVLGVLISHYATTSNVGAYAHLTHLRAEIQRDAGAYLQDKGLLLEARANITRLRRRGQIISDDVNMEGTIVHSMAMVSSYAEQFGLLEESIALFEEALDMDEHPFMDIVYNYVDAVNSYCDLISGDLRKRAEVERRAREFICRIAGKHEQNGYLRECSDDIGDYDD